MAQLGQAFGSLSKNEVNYYLNRRLLRVNTNNPARAQTIMDAIRYHQVRELTEPPGSSSPTKNGACLRSKLVGPNMWRYVSDKGVPMIGYDECRVGFGGALHVGQEYRTYESDTTLSEVVMKLPSRDGKMSFLCGYKEHDSDCLIFDARPHHVGRIFSYDDFSFEIKRLLDVSKGMIEEYAENLDLHDRAYRVGCDMGQLVNDRASAETDEEREDAQDEMDTLAQNTYIPSEAHDSFADGLYSSVEDYEQLSPADLVRRFGV